ncbi:MAG: hypothetical protein WCD80_03170 [Desulfobaccales bacterium]
MSSVFSFFLRLLLCFVGARFLLQAIGVPGRNYLVGLTALLLVNVYVFSYLVFRERTRAPAPEDRGAPPGPPEHAPEVKETPENPAPPEV